MHIYVNNYLIAGNQPEMLKELIVEIGKKAGIRVIVHPNYVSFAPPVDNFLVVLSISKNLKALEQSLKERLSISGFITEPVSKERQTYLRKLKKIQLTVREGKPGIYWRGFITQKSQALLLQETLDLKEIKFKVAKLRGDLKKQIILQGDKDTLVKAEDGILEWIFLQAKIDTIPTWVKNVYTYPDHKLPDPFNVLAPNLPATEQTNPKGLDKELEDLPLGDNITQFLQSDDPRAEKLQETIKKFYETQKKPSVPSNLTCNLPPNKP